MSLISIDGFEAGDFAARSISSTGSLLRGASTRFGYGYAAQQQNNFWTRPIVTPSAKVTVGWAWYCPVLASTTICQLLADSGATTHCQLALTIAGALTLGRAGVVVATSAGALITAGAWHYLELTSSISDTIGLYEVRLNGTMVATFTGDTKNAGTSTNYDTIRFTPAGTNVNNFWDDMYVLNDLGSAPYNAPLGDVRVQTLVPTGPGALTDLTPLSGTNWDNVDELPPSMTDYNFSSTAAHKDTYAMSDLVLGTTQILAAAANAYALKNDAGARSIKNLLRIGGANYAGPTRALSTTVQTQVGIFELSPASGIAFTPTEVNAMESGIEVV